MKRCDPWLSRRAESTGFRAVVGEGGRKPDKDSEHDDKVDDDGIRPGAGPKWTIHKDLEDVDDDEEKASRPIQRVHFNRNSNVPKWLPKKKKKNGEI